VQTEPRSISCNILCNFVAVVDWYPIYLTTHNVSLRYVVSNFMKRYEYWIAKEYWKWQWSVLVCDSTPKTTKNVLPSTKPPDRVWGPRFNRCEGPCSRGKATLGENYTWFSSSATELYHRPSQRYLYVDRYVYLKGVREATKSLLEYSVNGPKEVMKKNRYL
jgi:hypothetical protein